MFLRSRITTLLSRSGITTFPFRSCRLQGIFDAARTLSRCLPVERKSLQRLLPGLTPQMTACLHAPQAISSSADHGFCLSNVFMVGLTISHHREVVIDNFSFSPKTFTIPASATVTWTNHGKAPHAVTSADNQFQKPPVLKAGQSFANAFATAGPYSYFCSIHPQMTGRIIVMQRSAED